MRDRILVTGATGFLGYYAAERWVAEGHEVRGLARSLDSPLPRGVERHVVGELSDRDAIRSALDGVETVVHLAARVHVTREAAHDALSEFRRVNVGGTEALLEEAGSAGVSDFVFASSIRAVGETSDEALTELTIAAPVDPYGVSKLEAEAVVSAASSKRLRTAALRFPLLYGPGMKANILTLFRAVARGLPLPLGGVNNRRSLLAAENAFVAMNGILDSQAENSQVYMISDGEDVSSPQLVSEIARALGRRPRLVQVPAVALRALGRLGDAAGGLFPVPISSLAVKRLTESLYVDSSLVWSRLNMRPPVSLGEGLVAAALWFNGAPSNEEGR